MEDNEGKVRGGEIRFIKRLVQEYKEGFLD